jgi:hypothetical protein
MLEVSTTSAFLNDTTRPWLSVSLRRAQQGGEGLGEDGAGGRWVGRRVVGRGAGPVTSGHHASQAGPAASAASPSPSRQRAGASTPRSRAPPVLHDLQQDGEHVRVRLLHLVEQHDGAGLAAHSLSQLAAVAVAHVACGGGERGGGGGGGQWAVSVSRIGGQWAVVVSGGGGQRWRRSVGGGGQIGGGRAGQLGQLQLGLARGAGRPWPARARAGRRGRAPGGAPMSLDTEWRSMYSDMSSRMMASREP